MKFKQDSAVVLLLAALIAVAIGIYRTGRQDAALQARAGRRPATDRSISVDQSSLITAEELVRLPTTTDERRFAEDALRLADQEMDIAFAQAVRSATAQQRPLSDEAKQIATRLEQAQRIIGADEARIAALAADSAKATPANVQAARDQLALARAQITLDQDEVDDARADLRRAGGDPQGRMQDMIQQHTEASASSDSVHVNVTTQATPRGLVNRINSLQSLYGKESQLRDAKRAADSLADVFQKRHDRFEARASARRDSSNTNLTHDSSAALLAMTQRRMLDEKSRAAFDQRVDNQKRLSDVYAGWIAVVTGQERAMINGALKGLAAILAIILVGLLLFRWTEHALGGRRMDRRSTQTAYMVTRVTLQVAAMLFILLVVFGPPDNFGTFVGLVGAGLTVALKDFIVGFIGWFVLMGKDGIRIGDLVEINGVTGEVVELGLFYTVLLETGSWNESGHPTGRRVTFMNGFAIEGHYFNFSTSGQWLWDEVRISVPSGRDPHVLLDAIKKELEEATSESAKLAEAEWQGARRSPLLAAINAAPSIMLKPVSGGVEVIARYITRASERADLRTKLYHTAVELLGGQPAQA